jgi:hypothetical protein
VSPVYGKVVMRHCKIFRSRGRPLHLLRLTGEGQPRPRHAANGRVIWIRLKVNSRKVFRYLGGGNYADKLFGEDDKGSGVFKRLVPRFGRGWSTLAAGSKGSSISSC